MLGRQGHQMKGVLLVSIVVVSESSERMNFEVIMLKRKVACAKAIQCFSAG